MPVPLIPSLLAQYLAHNTSANAAYTKAHFAANFTGLTAIDNSGNTIPVDSTKWDDSFNSVTPCHVSPVSIKTLMSNFAGPFYAHIVPWFKLAAGSHITVGVDNSSASWCSAMIADLQRRGFDGITIDWYGSGRYEDTVTLQIKAQMASIIGSGFTYAIMMDQGGYVDTASLQANLTYATTTYFSETNYRKIGGKPVVLFFGTVGGVDYAATKAAFPNTYWVMQGPGQLGNAWADAVMDWVQPYLTGVPGGDPYNAAAANSFLTATHSTAKGVMPCLSSGFDGYLTHSSGWSLGKFLPSNFGQCWLSQASVINANIPTNCIGVQVATFNDWEEGTQIESGIDNGLILASSITNGVLTWSFSGGVGGGDESTVSYYKVLASPDGISAVDLGTVNPGLPKTLDLKPTGLDPNVSYQIYALAVGVSCLRTKSAPIVYWTPPGPGPSGDPASDAYYLALFTSQYQN